MFICVVSESLSTAHLHSSRGDVWSFGWKNFIFCGFSTVVFPVINSGGVFWPTVSGKARFFLVCRFGKFNEIG